MLSLICPFDGLPLTRDRQTSHCTSGHSFDWSREGYLNLLSVQAKQSKDPGDSPDMVSARRLFLTQGYYDPIIQAVADLCVTQHTGFSMLDAGCGEGYYLKTLQTLSANQNPDLYGLDISKHAVKAAAKTNRIISWLVASNRQIPLAAQSMNIILCAFGFPVWHEFKRVLKSDGIVIMADPGPEHLLELRQALYTDIKTKQAIEIAPDGFTLTDTHNVHYTTAIQSADHLRHLIAMTPHQHRVSGDTIERVVHTPFPKLTIDVILRVFTVGGHDA